MGTSGEPGLDGAGLSHGRLMRMKWGICRGDTPHPCSSFIQVIGWLSRRPFVLIILGFQFCGKLRWFSLHMDADRFYLTLRQRFKPRLK